MAECAFLEVPVGCGRGMKLVRRSPNLTYCEIETVIESLESLPELACYVTDADFNMTEVEKISWEVVASNVNAHSVIIRDASELRDKWAELVSRTQIKVDKLIESNQATYEKVVRLLAPLERRIVELITRLPSAVSIDVVNDVAVSQSSPPPRSGTPNKAKELQHTKEPHPNEAVSPAFRDLESTIKVEAVSRSCSSASFISPSEHGLASPPQLDDDSNSVASLERGPVSPPQLNGDSNTAGSSGYVPVSSPQLNETSSTAAQRTNFVPLARRVRAIRRKGGFSRMLRRLVEDGRRKEDRLKQLAELMEDFVWETRQHRMLDVERKDIEAKRLDLEKSQLDELRKHRESVSEGVCLLRSLVSLQTQQQNISIHNHVTS